MKNQRFGCLYINNGEKDLENMKGEYTNSGWKVKNKQQDTGRGFN